jgi:hypothetical protein
MSRHADGRVELFILLEASKRSMVRRHKSLLPCVSFRPAKVYCWLTRLRCPLVFRHNHTSPESPTNERLSNPANRRHHLELRSVWNIQLPYERLQSQE